MIIYTIDFNNPQENKINYLEKNLDVLQSMQMNISAIFYRNNDKRKAQLNNFDLNKI